MVTSNPARVKALVGFAPVGGDASPPRSIMVILNDHIAAEASACNFGVLGERI